MKIRLAPDQNLNYDSKDRRNTYDACVLKQIHTCQLDGCHLHCCCAGIGLFDFAVAGGL